MPIRAVFFDLDDTLLDTWGPAGEALDATCEYFVSLFPGHDPGEVRETAIRVSVPLTEVFDTGRSIYQSGWEFRVAQWQGTLEQCGLPPDRAPDIAHRYLEERRARYRLYPEVPEALEPIVRRYRCLMVTNGPSDLQRDKMARVRLERWVPDALVSGEVGSWKPEAGIFRAALEQAGVAPHEAVMVGDHPINDIRGAAALGIRTIWMNRRGLQWQHDHPHDAALRDLHGLLDLVGGW